MIYAFHFLLWTLMLYWIHRIGHRIKFINYYHAKHHSFINNNMKSGNKNTWHWNNLFLFNDNYESTVDLWITEVVPTFLFSLITGHWWIFIFYYVWAAFIQETIEHNINIEYPLLLSGKRHLIHHSNPNKNFGLFFSIWDRIFKTYEQNEATKWQN